MSDETLTNARITDPSTSIEAAQSIDVSGRQQDVIDALGTLGDGTAYEIADRIAVIRGTNEIPSNISSRITELVHKGLVEVIGQRQSIMGKANRVYRLTDAGHQPAVSPVR